MVAYQLCPIWPGQNESITPNMQSMIQLFFPPFRYQIMGIQPISPFLPDVKLFQSFLCTLLSNLTSSFQQPHHAMPSHTTYSHSHKHLKQTPKKGYQGLASKLGSHSELALEDSCEHSPGPVSLIPATAVI